MKKFIEAIKEQGIMDRMVKSVIHTSEITGKDDCPVGAVGLMLKFEMLHNDDLFELFMDSVSELGFKAVHEVLMKEVQEYEKCEALKDCDPDALFAKATGKEAPAKEEKQDMNKKDDIDKAIMNLLDTVVKSIMDDLK